MNVRCLYLSTFILFILILSVGKSYSQTIVTESDQKVIIGDVIVEGNHRTRGSIILRELAIKSGDTIAAMEFPEKVEIDRRKVVNLNLFITVELLPKPNADSIRTDLHILVKERWYLIIFPVFSLADRNFNEWWYDRNRDFRRTIYGAYMSYANVTGRNDKLRFLAELGFIPKFDVSYSLPYIDKAQKTGITFGASYSLNKSMAFRTWRDKLDFVSSEAINRERFFSYVNISRRNKYYTFHSLDLRYSYANISDTIAALNPNYLLKGRTRQNFFQLSYSFSYDRRDNFQYPLRGQTAGFQISKIGLLPSDDVNQLFFYGSFRKYFAISKRFYANAGMRMRISTPKRQPYLQTVGLGYRNDLVRGYELYVVDGQSYGLFKSELKFKLLSIQKHFDWIPVKQFNTIPLAMYLNTFADAGYVQNKYPELSNTRLGNKMLYGAGAGLDVVTFYNIVARMNLTFNAKGERRFFFNVFREF
jgi:outer membrane protein assembly factor BamA